MQITCSLARHRRLAREHKQMSRWDVTHALGFRKVSARAAASASSRARSMLSIESTCPHAGDLPNNIGKIDIFAPLACQRSRRGAECSARGARRSWQWVPALFRKHTATTAAPPAAAFRSAHHNPKQAPRAAALRAGTRWGAPALSLLARITVNQTHQTTRHARTSPSTQNAPRGRPSRPRGALLAPLPPTSSP